MTELAIFTRPKSDLIVETELHLARTNQPTFCHTDQQFNN